MNHRYNYISEIRKFIYRQVVKDCGYIPSKSGPDLADETIVHTTRQDIIFSSGMLNNLQYYNYTSDYDVLSCNCQW